MNDACNGANDPVPASDAPAPHEQFGEAEARPSVEDCFDGICAHEGDCPAMPAASPAQEATPPRDWWNGGASPEAIRATAGRLLAFITKHAAQTPEEMPLLHDVHVLVANATHRPRKP